MSSSGLKGQVAQLVEQGIENPRVGGSTPSLATLLLCVVSALWGCSDDACVALCTNTARDLEQCRQAWGVSWETLGAESQADWSAGCQNEWDGVRADLEAREVPAADDQCSDAQSDINAVGDGSLETRCDVLRALYVN